MNHSSYLTEDCWVVAVLRTVIDIKLNGTTLYIETLQLCLNISFSVCSNVTQNYNMIIFNHPQHLSTCHDMYNTNIWTFFSKTLAPEDIFFFLNMYILDYKIVYIQVFSIKSVVDIMYYPPAQACHDYKATIIWLFINLVSNVKRETNTRLTHDKAFWKRETFQISGIILKLNFFLECWMFDYTLWETRNVLTNK